MITMIKKLKDLGLKLTPQRLAILKLFEGNKNHPSAEDIYNKLKPDFPSLSLATVYNTLEVLTKAGILQEIKIKIDKRNFDPNPESHGHFLCRICDVIYDLDIGTIKVRTPATINGYLLESLTVNYYGLCPTCLKRMYDNKPFN